MICGGGTGGHLYPAIALAKALQAKDPSVEIQFVGTSRGIENKVIPGLGYKLEVLPSKPLRRKISFDVFPFFWANVKGLCRSVSLIKRFSPDVVVGFGGYASFGPILASYFLKIPRMLHEQNIVPGLANRILSRFSSEIAVSHKTSMRFFKSKAKMYLTGNPVREEYTVKYDRKTAAEQLNLNSELKTVLVFGGSQGAKAINKAMVEAYPLLKDKAVQIIHIAGKNGYEETKKIIDSIKANTDRLVYRLYDFYEKMNIIYGISDLVICRAGATTISEITAQRLPSILIPYPYASENHQEINAKALRDTGAAEIIHDSEINGLALAQEVEKMLFNDKLLEKMQRACDEYASPNAADLLAGIVAKNRLVKESDER
jgi:UDP-N-acetylglucosamine--N-acetylmuramyl-(pentapeptide) pyrophosphoryl-undecaprenol N-acetylglucosamine transferase